MQEVFLSASNGSGKLDAVGGAPAETEFPPSSPLRRRGIGVHALCIVIASANFKLAGERIDHTWHRNTILALV